MTDRNPYRTNSVGDERKQHVAWDQGYAAALALPENPYTHNHGSTLHDVEADAWEQGAEAISDHIARVLGWEETDFVALAERIMPSGHGEERPESMSEDEFVECMKASIKAFESRVEGTARGEVVQNIVGGLCVSATEHDAYKVIGEWSCKRVVAERRKLAYRVTGVPVPADVSSLDDAVKFVRCHFAEERKEAAKLNEVTKDADAERVNIALRFGLDASAGASHESLVQAIAGRLHKLANERDELESEWKLYAVELKAERDGWKAKLEAALDERDEWKTECGARVLGLEERVAGLVLERDELYLRANDLEAKLKEAEAEHSVIFRKGEVYAREKILCHLGLSKVDAKDEAQGYGHTIAVIDEYVRAQRADGSAFGAKSQRADLLEKLDLAPDALREAAASHSSTWKAIKAHFRQLVNDDAEKIRPNEREQVLELLGLDPLASLSRARTVEAIKARFDKVEADRVGLNAATLERCRKIVNPDGLLLPTAEMARRLVEGRDKLSNTVQRLIEERDQARMERDDLRAKAQEQGGHLDLLLEVGRVLGRKSGEPVVDAAKRAACDLELLRRVHNELGRSGRETIFDAATRVVRERDEWKAKADLADAKREAERMVVVGLHQKIAAIEAKCALFDKHTGSNLNLHNDDGPRHDRVWLLTNLGLDTGNAESRARTLAAINDHIDDCKLKAVEEAAERMADALRRAVKGGAA